MANLLSNWFLMELIGAIGLIFAGIYIYFKHVLYTYWQKKGIIYPEPTVPFGNISEFIKGKICVGKMYQNIYEEYKKNRYVGMYTFHKPSLVICDPDLIRMVLTKSFKNFHDRGLYCNEEVDPLSGHLFLLPGSKWKNLRTKLVPTFTPGKIKKMVDILRDCAEKMSNHLEKFADRHEVVEMKEITSRLTSDIISRIAFGIDSNCLENPNSEFRTMGKKTFEPQLIKNAMMLYTPKVMDFFQIKFTDKYCAEFFTKVFEDTVNYRMKNNIIQPDFMNLLIQLMKKGSVDNDDEEEVSHISETTEGTITMLEGAAQAFLFFLAGYETTSATITYTLYELSRECNKDIQQKVRADIDQVLNNHNGKITYESIQQMTYLHKVINETLRKYPPLPLLNRICTEDFDEPNTDLKISKGTDIVIPILGLHHDPDIYPDPEKYDPERFNEANIAARHPYSFLAFGEGPRICIGQRLGYIQTKTILITLLSKYKFSLGPNIPDPLEYDAGIVMLTSKGGIDLRIEPR